MNEWHGIGRLTKDVDLRYTTDGKAVGRFSIAINTHFRDKSSVDYIPVVVFDKLAENCKSYIYKGSLVGVSGRIKTGSYEKADGTKVYTTEIYAGSVEFLSSNTAEKTAGTAEIPGAEDYDKEPIPF